MSIREIIADFGNKWHYATFSPVIGMKDKTEVLDKALLAIKQEVKKAMPLEIAGDRQDNEYIQGETYGHNVCLEEVKQALDKLFDEVKP